MFATIGFALKAGLAFGGAALSWVEDAVGYGDGKPVTDAHIEMFRVSNTLVPAGLFVIWAFVRGIRVAGPLKTEAVVLRSMRYGEADRILHV